MEIPRVVVKTKRGLQWIAGLAPNQNTKSNINVNLSYLKFTIRKKLTIQSSNFIGTKIAFYNSIKKINFLNIKKYKNGKNNWN